MSISTIKRAILRLEGRGLLKSSQFNKMKIDKTKWYSIDYYALKDLQNTATEDEMNEKQPYIEEIPVDSMASVQNEQTRELDCIDERIIITQLAPQNEQRKRSNWTDVRIKMNRAIPEITTEISPKNTSETTKKILDGVGAIIPSDFMKKMDLVRLVALSLKK